MRIMHHLLNATRVLHFCFFSSSCWDYEQILYIFPRRLPPLNPALSPHSFKKFVTHFQTISLPPTSVSLAKAVQAHWLKANPQLSSSLPSQVISFHFPGLSVVPKGVRALTSKSLYSKTYLTNSHSFDRWIFMGFLWDFIYWRYKRSCLSKG
ncbi:hypothetical protein BC829DRAFT_84842 [Chytridium lagenaria]|nr:hypothetical protein BC829DRAFT_84842 [Chytridium lagenaria]